MRVCLGIYLQSMVCIIHSFSNSASSPNYLVTIIYLVHVPFSVSQAFCNLLPLVHAACVFIALLAVLGLLYFCLCLNSEKDHLSLLFSITLNAPKNSPSTQVMVLYVDITR